MSANAKRVKKEMKELQQKYNSERESREAAEMEQNRLFIFSIMNAMVGYNAQQFFYVHSGQERSWASPAKQL